MEQQVGQTLTEVLWEPTWQYSVCMCVCVDDDDDVRLLCWTVGALAVRV